MKFSVRKIVGLTLIVGSIALLGFWELWGRRNVGYVEIPVLSMTIDANTVLRSDHFTTKKVENPRSEILRMKDREKVIGMMSGQLIREGEPLYEEYFEDSAFAVGGQTGRFVLPVPERWVETYPQTVRRGDRVYFYSDGEIVVEATVAYARGTGNKEIYSINGDRRDGTAPVSLLEVIVTEAEAGALSTLADMGKRFVILYA